MNWLFFPQFALVYWLIVTALAVLIGALKARVGWATALGLLSIGLPIGTLFGFLYALSNPALGDQMGAAFVAFFYALVVGVVASTIALIAALLFKDRKIARANV